MRLIFLAALAALAVGAVGSTAGHSTSLRLTAESTTFSDAVGEDLAAPDIGTVVVSNDDTGLLTFRIEIPNHPLLTEDLRIRVWLDTDADSETGLRGADRYLLVDRWELGLGEVALFTCGSTACSGGKALPTRSGPPLRFAYRDGATLTAEAADLGIVGPQRIVFWIEAWSGIGFDPVTRRYDLTNARPDFAPDGAGASAGLSERGGGGGRLDPRLGFDVCEQLLRAADEATGGQAVQPAAGRDQHRHRCARDDWDRRVLDEDRRQAASADVEQLHRRQCRLHVLDPGGH